MDIQQCKICNEYPWRFESHVCDPLWTVKEEKEDEDVKIRAHDAVEAAEKFVAIKDAEYEVAEGGIDMTVIVSDDDGGKYKFVVSGTLTPEYTATTVKSWRSKGVIKMTTITIADTSYLELGLSQNIDKGLLLTERIPNDDGFIVDRISVTIPTNEIDLLIEALQKAKEEIANSTLTDREREKLAAWNDAAKSIFLKEEGNNQKRRKL